MKRVFWQKVFITICAVVVSVMAPLSTYAKLSEDEIYFYGQNGIYFYDTGGCPVTPNNIYKGEQYNLTDAELRGLARAAQKENGCSVEALKSELSLRLCMPFQAESKAS